MQIPWSQLKSFIDNHKAKIVERPDGNNYFIDAYDGPALYTSFLREGTSDLTDYEDNYQSLAGIQIDPRDADGRATVHHTIREHGYTTYFSSSDDDHTDANAVGGSSNIYDCVWEYTLTDGATKTIYLDYNTIANETHLHAGIIQFKDALNDYMKVQVVPKVTTTSAGTSTNYNEVGGYLIVPAAGDGTLAVNNADRVLVEAPVDLDTGVRAAGYWDATYNSGTGAFDSITANNAGTGRYNMFSSEVVLGQYVNRFPMLGSGQVFLTSYDRSYAPHNARLKVIVTRNGAAREWYGSLTVIMFRKKTI